MLCLLCQGKFYVIASCAHMLNLIVQDCLKVIDDSMHKIRENVKCDARTKTKLHKDVEVISHCGCGWMELYLFDALLSICLLKLTTNGY